MNLLGIQEDIEVVAEAEDAARAQAVIVAYELGLVRAGRESGVRYR